MSAQMPELGSKISLISKADIRYEGRLFTVDPAECTIALANVRSFGTEDRETQYPVPAQTQVYDYILFRGSDIKDIRVVNNQIPNDPAIVQLGPMGINQQQAGYQNQAFSHPVMGAALGTSIPQYPGYGGMAGLPTGNLGGMQRAPGPLIMQPSELGAPGQAPGPPQAEGPHPGHQPSSVPIGPLSIDKEQDLIGGVSRSTTPSLTRKSPTNDQGTQVNNSPARDEHKKPRPIQPPHRERDASRRDQPLYQPGQGFQRDRERDRDYQVGRRDYQQRGQGDYQHRGQNEYQQRGQGEYQHRGQHEYQQRGQGDYQFQRRGNRAPRDGPPRGEREVMDQQQRGPQQPWGGQRGMGGGMGGLGGNRQRGGRPRGPPKQFNRQAGAPAGKKNTLKFDDDYDFDKANKEFEELQINFNKVKIGNEVEVAGTVMAADAKLNGEAEKKDDSGNETGAGENEHEEESIPECYNKSKSFFDTISCEAVERSKGRSQRTDWRTERKLNSETFGVASARRGAYRGRGYHGGRQGYRQGGFRPRGLPRGEQTVGPTDSKPAAATEEKPVPVAGGVKK